jgi:two-component system, chemotaxis family, CheB/CheR fusion protein
MPEEEQGTLADSPAGAVSPHLDASEDSDQNHEPQQQYPVVAVGASAGGLEAFTELLRHLPADTGMAFVFIQHLAPGHESVLAQLLSRETTMPVNQVEDGTVLSPNQVYVIPPNAAMTMSGPALTLRPRKTAGTAVDAFLRSLAESRKGAAAAVILSGTGSDGALGVQAIAEEGGVVFAQDPASAKFDGMPSSAIATGCVDFVLPPDGIAAELARIASDPNLIRRDIKGLSRPVPDSDADLQPILDLMRAGTGIDFSLYRRSTVRRRVLRRVALLKRGSLDEYLQHVKENPDELHTLGQDILIRVTRFFRDSEAFEALSRRVLPALLRKTTPARSVRIWVPGCSTGEEAYSIAICLLEAEEQLQSRASLQVFATDINEAAIERARRGAYIENIAADVSPKRLTRFFVRVGKEFQVSRAVRDMCVFSRHDLLNDPPFSRMDLVSCRNVLIYLESAHEYALSRFHFALNPGGFLLLGKSETAASPRGLFAPSEKAVKLYVRLESAGHLGFAPTSRKRAAVPHPRREPVLPPVRPPRGIDLRRWAERAVTEQYGPLWMIVNGNLETAADSELARESRSSTPDVQGRQLLDSVKNACAGALENAVQTAARSGQSIRIERVRLGDGASTREVNIKVSPLGPEGQNFLIVFEDQAGHAEAAPESGTVPPPDIKHRSKGHISRLEKELASTRAHLESIIVEHEAANEEVVAANEELQSLNEELESSKEELEAANEELATLNQELQIRNAEAESAREFAQATIDTVRGSLVVLGPDLRVLTANRSFQRAFRMSPAEVEHRFVYELGGGLWSIPRLRQLLEEILPANKTMEDFEVEYEHPTAGRRILLLNAHRFEREERILLAIEDVTEIRRLGEEMRQSQKMEAIGYLAAGVAHDFNNLLTTIIGHASLLLQDMPDDDRGRPALNNILLGGERAADLTRQLLAYAGKSRTFLERLDLSEVAVQTSKLVHPSIPAGVQLRLDLDRHLPLLLADPGQMEQIAMNLIINGAEAIGSAGGTVLVRTGRQAVGDEPLPDLYLNDRLAPGIYVFLEVTDNGAGMTPQTVLRIFDPFFTTKFAGRGLGLAAVLGIVRQNKGALQVHSVPGRGSTFRVLFPAAETALAQAASAGTGELRGAGTILVVDDEEMIRSFTKSALELCGYNVLLAPDGQQAVRLFLERSGDIGLVLLDAAMPGMDGPEILERIHGIRPGVPVLVCSGFGDVDLEARFAGKEIAGLFTKPYTVRQLASKVKECMPASEACD